MRTLIIWVFVLSVLVLTAWMAAKEIRAQQAEPAEITHEIPFYEEEELIPPTVRL